MLVSASTAPGWLIAGDRSKTAFHFRDGEAFDAVFGGTQASDLVLTGSCDAALLFGSASPTITMDDAERLATLLLVAYEPRRQTDWPLSSSTNQLTSPGDRGNKAMDWPPTYSTTSPMTATVRRGNRGTVGWLGRPGIGLTLDDRSSELLHSSAAITARQSP